VLFSVDDLEISQFGQKGDYLIVLPFIA